MRFSKTINDTVRFVCFMYPTVRIGAINRTEPHRTDRKNRTVKNPANLFPGECPRRFFFYSDREFLHTSSLCPCEYLTVVVAVVVDVLPAFPLVKIFRKLWTTVARIFTVKKRKIKPPGCHTSEWVCNTRVQNFKAYFSKTAWRFGLLCVKLSKIRYFLLHMTWS